MIVMLMMTMNMMITMLMMMDLYTSNLITFVLFSDIIDIKPDNLEELNEVITCCEYHPVDYNLCVYSTSKGFIRMADTRMCALCDGAQSSVRSFSNSMSAQGDASIKNFFSELLSSISHFR